MRAIALALAGCMLLALPAAAQSAPVASLGSFTESTNPQYQHADGNVLWFNGAQTGSMVVRVTAVDDVAGPGVDRVDFPNLGSGWWLGGSDDTEPSPYAWAYDWTPGSTGASVNAIAWSLDGSSVSVPFEVRDDSTAPIGGSVTTPNVTTDATSVDVTFVDATDDGGSGIGSAQLERRSATLTAGSCSGWSAWSSIGTANPTSPYTDSALLDGTCYEYRLVAVDNVGNARTNVGAGTVKVDRAPSGSATVAFASATETAGSQYQHASGSTIWFNPARAGSFNVNATASALPGLASVTFPTLGTGWTPGVDPVETSSPYTAAYAWSAGASSPGARSMVATSTGGVTGSGGFTVTADAAAPVGATITAQSTVTRDTSAPVSGTAGVDAGSGIGSWRFQRRSATLAGDACGTYGAWLDIQGMNPAGPISDASLPDASCLQYQLVVADNVGNATTATQDGELRVDRTAPTGAIDPILTSLHGNVTLRGTAFDSTTRVRSVAVIVEDRYSICASAPLIDGRWTCDWSIGPRELGAANVTVTVTDAAGQRTSVTQAVTIVAPPSPLGPKEEDVDRTPPVVGLARMPLISWTDRVKVKASAYDERPGTLEIRIEQQSAGAASVRFSPWAPSFEESEIVPLEDRGETTCFRGIAIDEAGNKATSHPRCTTLPLDDMDLTATGRWDEVRSGGAWLGSARRTTRRGSALTTRVADANPVVVVTKCARCGSIRVMHGRRVVGVYSLRARKTLARQLIQLPVLRRPTSAPLRIVAVNAKPVIIDALVAAR